MGFFKRIKKAFKNPVRGILAVSTLGGSETLIEGANFIQKGLGANAGKPPKPGEAPAAPTAESVQESVDERRRRLSILRSGLPQNTLSFFGNNPQTNKKTLLGG